MNVTVDIDCIYEESITVSGLSKNRRVIKYIDKLLTYTKNICTRSPKAFNMRFSSRHYKSFLQIHLRNLRNPTIKINEFYYIPKEFKRI